jgi:hypothetical protein
MYAFLFISFIIFIYFMSTVRKEKLANPRHRVSEFGSNTGPSNIRKHLYTHHIADWVQACDEKKIRITGADALRAVARFRKLPEPTELEAERPDFTHEGFVDAIAELIVGDDLVSKKKLFGDILTYLLF